MKREYITMSSYFSECTKYRYLLTRVWNQNAPSVMCIGLNPSTANSATDDQTIKRLVDILDHHGFGTLNMCNLYALISSVPEALFTVPDALGENDKWLLETVSKSDKLIFCWGDFKGIDYRAKYVRYLMPKAGMCFGKNKSGSPIHPQRHLRSGIKAIDVKIIPYE